MGLHNIVAYPTTTHNTSYTNNRSGSVSGSPSSVYDNNDGTYYKIFNVASGGGNESGNCSMTSTHTWADPIALKSVRGKLYTRCYSLGNYANRGVNPRNLQQIFLRIGGVWTNVWEFRSSYPGGDAQPNETVNTDQTVSTGWDNVTGVRVYLLSQSYAYEGSRYNDTTCQIFEIQAYGLIDAGLRIKTAGVVESIGTELLQTDHKLRMYDGSAVVGIPLVNTSEPYAAKTRIYDGSGVQSLPKI